MPKETKGGKRDLRGQATNSVTGTVSVKATTSEAKSRRRYLHMKDLGFQMFPFFSLQYLFSASH